MSNQADGSGAKPEGSNANGGPGSLDAKYGAGFTAFLWSIAMQESNNYSVVNKSSGALGRYQVMPANVASWTQRALGHSLTPEEFLHNHKAQDKTVIYMLGHDYASHGARGAAAIWYSGQAHLANDYSPQQNGPSVGDYVDSVVHRMKSAPAQLDLAVGTQIVPTGSGESVANLSSNGGAGSGGGGMAALSQDIGPKDIRQGLNSMGFASQLIHSNKSLEQAFNQIVGEKLDLSSASGQARATQILQNSKWFQNHTKAQRQFDELKYSDPTQWANQIQQARDQLHQQAISLGLQLHPNELEHMARIVTRNGLTSTEVNQLMAKHFTFSQNQNYDGTIGQTVDSIRQQAQNYYVPVTDQMLQHYTRQVIGGQLDPNSLADRFKQQALSMFPYLKDQLNGGQTVAQIVDPYKQMYAQTLEVDPNGIKHNDPLLMQALQTKDAQGNLGIMPLWAFQQKLYDDPRWLNTQNAKTSLVSATGSILQKMGLIA